MTLTMQADGSAVVWELAAVVLVLACSLISLARGGILVAHLYSAQPTHSPERLTSTTHVPQR